MGRLNNERRQYPRFRCEGKAEIRVRNSSGVWWGTLTDLSAGGCYIEMASPLPPGTVARLTLTLREHRTRGRGKSVGGSSDGWYGTVLYLMARE